MKFAAASRALVIGAAFCASAQAELLSYQYPQPLLEAKAFAPGVVSTDAFEINTVLNQQGDNVIFSRCDNEFSHCVMMESEYLDGHWQTPKKLPFSGDYPDGDPFYSADYQFLYFISKRPINQGTKTTESYNLWRVAKTTRGWAEPEFLQKLSSNSHDLYPSMDDRGNLYFPSFRNGERHLYVAKPKHFGFDEPEALPAHIYGENGKTGDAAISRNGKVIVFSISGRQDSQGKGDLYASRYVNGEWTVAQSLGSKINTSEHEFTPIISPDGKYLFFTRIENGVGNLYQIDLSTVGLSLEMDSDGELSYRQRALDAAAKGQTLAGIALTEEWQKALYELAANSMQHPAWGMNHSERNYLMTEKLAAEEGVSIDTDVLFAAAFVHDMGTFEPWAIAGADHSKRASELAPALLTEIGFPKEKIAHVQELIMGHMFYAKTSDDKLVQLFHDADTLDFLGVTGITRILSLNGQSGIASNTAKAIDTLSGFKRDLPKSLISAAAKARGDLQAREMKQFLNSLKTDTAGYLAP